MPTTFLKGDILHEASEGTGPRALAFGADCDGTMDTGIAVAVRQRWPAFAEAYRAHCAGGKFQLGDVFAWRPEGESHLIVYAMGLQSAGAKPKISTFERAALAVVSRTEADGVQRVLLPRIGAGKNGLDWVRVKRILTEISRGKAANLVVYEQFVRQAPPTPTDG
ncbi:macro domain-containing protein [Pendulispora rubella]|uniref:Macro domain-containing protein n=1 Tax=Pendulispora rubella TaxID=2741070 RepID=A0ABZ2L530_9BACT